MFHEFRGAWGYLIHLNCLNVRRQIRRQSFNWPERNLRIKKCPSMVNYQHKFNNKNTLWGYSSVFTIDFEQVFTNSNFFACYLILVEIRKKAHLPVKLFQRSVAFHIETSQLFCTANQRTGFCMKCNTGVKRVKYLAIFSVNHCLPRLLFYQPIMFPNTIILHRIYNMSFNPLMPGGNKRSYILKQTCNCLLQNQCFSTIFSNTVIKTDNTPLFLGL